MLEPHTSPRAAGSLNFKGGGASSTYFAFCRTPLRAENCIMVLPPPRDTGVHSTSILYNVLPQLQQTPHISLPG